MKCSLPLRDRDQDSRFLLSHFQESGHLCKKKQFFKYFRISCARMVLKYLQSLPAHVLRLMSHCFFPLKLYRLLLYTNHCQTIPMCTSCVFPAVNTITETNWIQSHTNFQVNIGLLPFFARWRLFQYFFSWIYYGVITANLRNSSLLIIVWCFWNMFWSVQVSCSTNLFCRMNLFFSVQF